MGKVVKFPAIVMADENVRRLQRLVEHFEYNIEHCDPDSREPEGIRARLAAKMLPEYQEDLRKAKAERAAFDAPNALHHNGKVYAEMAGRA